METKSIQYYATKRSLKEYMQKSFVIPSRLQHELSEYKCLFWSADYFLDNCFQGKLKRDGKEYSIIYQDCTRGQILELCNQFKNAQIKLSFRSARKHWNLQDTVIVKIAAIKPQLRVDGNTYIKTGVEG